MLRLLTVLPNDFQNKILCRWLNEILSRNTTCSNKKSVKHLSVILTRRGSSTTFCIFAHCVLSWRSGSILPCVGAELNSDRSPSLIRALMISSWSLREIKTDHNDRPQAGLLILHLSAKRNVHLKSVPQCPAKADTQTANSLGNSWTNTR